MDPLVIEKQGYFFVGGKYFTTDKGRFMSGHMYVEYQIPQNRTQPFPVVMWHGGGQTGTNFLGTPDGREGWMQYFLRRGYAVYVVDQPGRGRSAYHPHAYGPASWRESSGIEHFTVPERSKSWPQAHLHNQWPGNGLAGDETFDQFYASQVPKMEDFSLAQSLNRDAGVALLDQIGPAVLLTHSQSGAFGWLIADARPKLVKAIVAAEPSGPPVYDERYGQDGPMVKAWGISDQPLTYFPAVSDPSQLSFVQQERADGPNLLPCWTQKGPVRELVNLKNIPVLILTTESSYHACYDHCTSRYLTQAGVMNTHIRLAEVGIRGNGHMMMLEKNNLQIAAVITGWLEKHVTRNSPM